MPLLILTHDGGNQEYPLAEESTIGRQPSSTIALSGSGVSREHAKIIREEGEYYLYDLGSGNGTLLNGAVLQPGEKTLLQPGDRIVIENFHFKFFKEHPSQSEAEEEEITEADILEVKLIKKILDAVDRDTLPSVEVLNSCALGKRIFLTDDLPEIVIGRDPDCDFCIPEEVISRQHAKIAKRWGGICLIDMESKNGSFVNNRRIQEEFLHDGDRLALGTVVLLFRNPQEIDLKGIEEEAVRKRPKTILKPLAKPTSPPPKRRDASTTTTQEETPLEISEVLEGLSPLQTASANVYPSVVAKEKRLNPLEIGLIGMGIIVLSFATITLVNLLLQ